MKPYPQADELLGPVHRVQMPRAPGHHAPGGPVHVVARCNNREFDFTTAADFDRLLAHLRGLVRTYDGTLYAYTLMANHVHLLLRAPATEALGRSLRWFLTETAKAFHKMRGRRGHFWERRYRAVLVKSESRPRGVGGRSPDLPLVELCGLCARHPESPHCVPPELPRLESLSRSAGAALPRTARPESRSDG